MAQRVGATDLRQRLTDVLQAVREQRETYVVETFGRPQAVLVNLDEYERLRRFQREREAFFDRLENVATRNAEANAGLSPEQVLAIIEQAREQVASEPGMADRQTPEVGIVQESRTLYSTDQVIVGKLAWATEEGQLSVFPLPPDLTWIIHFSARHLAGFLTELLAALPQAQRTGDWSTVDEVLESWKATANIEADPALAKAVDEGTIELEEGRGTTWSDLRHELDL
jgi:prevent-host-death family protein